MGTLLAEPAVAGPSLQGGALVTVGDAPDGPEAAFRAWYGPLAGWCLHLVGDTETAHDLAAEAFARLLGRWSSVREPRAFLYATALNLVRDQWRRRESERRGISRLLAGRPTSDPEPEPELWLVVRNLPTRSRDVLLLHYYADLPVREIATALHVAEGTVKRDLSDARAQLLAQLEGSR